MATPASPDKRTLLARGWIRRLLLLAVSLLLAVAIFRFVQNVDWQSVGEALTHLTWWQPLILLGFLLVRQLLNAAPLSYYIHGVSLYRATINDLAAATLTAFAPPPSDMALRVSIFASWGIKPSTALAGITMNAMTFFIVRFSAPLAGFILVALSGYPLGFRWLDILSLAIAAFLVVGVLLIVRAETLAFRVGSFSGKVMRRFKSGIDPDHWGAACTNFRAELAERFTYAFPRALVASALMVACDFLILLLAIRFVGVSPESLSVIGVAIAFLFAFPLTAFPVTGLGVVDTLILVACTEMAGQGIAEPVLAALAIWRVFTLGGPFVMGVLATVLWKHTSRKSK